MSLYSPRERTGSWWQDHNLSVSLALVLLVHLAITYPLAYHGVWVGDQEAHGQPVLSMFSSDYALWYAAESNLSLLAEPWGVLAGVLLANHFLKRTNEKAA